MSTILDIRNATVTYQDGETTTTALAEASLNAESNTLTAIVGESGSGKSTLLSVAAGLITPDSGSVQVDGTRSIIFQQANLLSSLNVRDQLLIMDHIAGRKLRPQRADELLEFVGLAGMGNRRMGQLSGGQRQRVNIARALMERPDLLLADEPTSALDSHLSQEIIRLLRDVTQEMNTATVLVTHDRSLLNFADRVVEVKDGHVSEQEKVSALG
ncbi:ABC transporter ATP-binding protein [Corynebacterium marquesiae]|uniref:ABC transporter ATP-binding protein n=1 Tax=Corynebacterium marquesiae TaxID=2913503 RepID=UPI00307FE865